jgi:hypothetical protein
VQVAAVIVENTFTSIPDMIDVVRFDPRCLCALFCTTVLTALLRVW